MEVITKSAVQTQKLAAGILEQAIKEPRQGALILALQGELGAGKTTFAQGLGEALGIKEKILSPTFVVMKRFILSHRLFTNLYHMDCYRLEESEELNGFGFDEIISNPKNLILIEWPEKIKDALSAEAIWLEFKYSGENSRKINLKI